VSPFATRGEEEISKASFLRAIVAPTAAILTQRHKMFTRGPGAKRAAAGFT